MQKPANPCQPAGVTDEQVLAGFDIRFDAEPVLPHWQRDFVVCACYLFGQPITPITLTSGIGKMAQKVGGHSW